MLKKMILIIIFKIIFVNKYIISSIFIDSYSYFIKNRNKNTFNIYFLNYDIVK